MTNTTAPVTLTMIWTIRRVSTGFTTTIHPGEVTTTPTLTADGMAITDYHWAWASATTLFTDLYGIHLTTADGVIIIHLSGDITTGAITIGAGITGATWVAAIMAAVTGAVVFTPAGLPMYLITGQGLPVAAAMAIQAPGETAIIYHQDPVQGDKAVHARV